jgi:hypothetical protein
MTGMHVQRRVARNGADKARAVCAGVQQLARLETHIADACTKLGVLQRQIAQERSATDAIFARSTRGEELERFGIFATAEGLVPGLDDLSVDIEALHGMDAEARRCALQHLASRFAQLQGLSQHLRRLVAVATGCYNTLDLSDTLERVQAVAADMLEAAEVHPSSADRFDCVSRYNVACLHCMHACKMLACCSSIARPLMPQRKQMGVAASALRSATPPAAAAAAAMPQGAMVCCITCSTCRAHHCCWWVQARVLLIDAGESYFWYPQPDANGNEDSETFVRVPAGRGITGHALAMRTLASVEAPGSSDRFDASIDTIMGASASMRRCMCARCMGSVQSTHALTMAWRFHLALLSCCVVALVCSAIVGATHAPTISRCTVRSCKHALQLCRQHAAGTAGVSDL